MGDQSCDRVFCPSCDLPLTAQEDECPDCGAAIPDT